MYESQETNTNTGVVLQKKEPVVRDPGSFRDPSGFVVYWEGRLFRLLYKQAFNTMLEIREKGILEKLITEKLSVYTRVLSKSAQEYSLLKQWSPEIGGALEHERLLFTNYPFEWTYSMIADAGLLTLDIQILLAERGFTLQDASAYNVFFDGSRPVFIDLTSIQKARRHDVWFALGQFQRMFLYPLLLAYHRSVSTKAYYLAHIDGLSADKTARIMGPSRYFRPSLFWDVTLPALFSRQARPGSKRRDYFENKKTTNPDVQLVTLRRLKRKITRLRKRYGCTGHWSDYTNTNSYTEQSESLKKGFVSTFMERYKPKTVTDFGCNTGQYSMIAASAGANVIAVDSDHDCVDSLYRSISGPPKSTIQPVWMDIDNPSPGIGFSNIERKPFLKRHEADAVFALALLHHLLVSARLPLSFVANLFAKLTKTWLVIEYVDPADPMFQSLSAFQPELYEHVTENAFTRAYEKDFSVVERLELPGGTRVLYLLKKKDASA